MELNWVSILPVILTIILTFVIKNVFFSLLSGIIVAGIIIDLKTGLLFTGLDSIYQVFQHDWATKSILSCLMIGAFVYVIEASGGVRGMVDYLTEKRKVVKSKLGAQLLAYIVGIFLFVDATSSIVISGVASRPLFDRFNVSREKLAYIIDSTSSPIAWLIPFNGAGAFLIAMIGGQVSAGIIDVEPMNVIISAMPFQVYGIVSILIVGMVICTKNQKNIEDNLSYKKIEIKEQRNYSFLQVSKEEIVPKAKNMIVPLGVLIISIMAIMYITGKGNLLKGDAAEGIYIGTIITLIFTGIYYIGQGVTDKEIYLKWVVRGIKNYLEVTMILSLAFAFSNLVSQLGTGEYIATISSGINPVFVPLTIFIIGAFMSFAIGTSSGTVAVLIPIVIPLVVTLGVSIPISIGAIISGGVFGDHCSPISDSTILSSMIAEIDVMDHVKSQMPYALLSAAITSVVFLVIGIID